MLLARMPAWSLIPFSSYQFSGLMKMSLGRRVVNGTIAGELIGLLSMLAATLSIALTCKAAVTAERVADLSDAVLLLVMRLRRRPLLPTMTGVPLVVFAGILDAIGNVLFVLGAQSGRLDMAAILSSLYPAATVGLSV